MFNKKQIIVLGFIVISLSMAAGFFLATMLGVREPTETVDEGTETGSELTPTALSQMPVTEVQKATDTAIPVLPAETPLPAAEPEGTLTQTPTPSPTLEQALTPTNSEQPPTETAQPAIQTHSVPSIIVDHNSIDLFEQIPEEYLQAAANLRMLFIDRSVGHNINDGLTCLSYSSDEDAPSHCARYKHISPNFSVDPSEVNWSRPGGYNRSNWDYLSWPQPGCSEWYNKVDCFITITEPVIDQYDVISFGFSYLAIGEGSSIEDQPGGFFWDNADYQDVYDHEAYETQHSDKIFIYWTVSLARPIGTSESEILNNQMRQYANDNNKVLFDVADILSHAPDGSPCYDNRDGVPYDNGNNSEDYPDDGLDIPAICQHYTTEVDGGHLGSVSTGKIRVAKAFWVLMARLAGWDGS